MKGELWSKVTLIGIVARAASVPTPAKESAPSCRPTHPEGGWVSNDELRLGTPTGGGIVFAPGGPGFVTSDGSLGWKFLWERFVAGTLRIDSGHVWGHRYSADVPDLPFARLLGDYRARPRQDAIDGPAGGESRRRSAMAPELS
jgi:hypothetical protein